MRTKDALGKPLKPDHVYYIEDARQIVGNCMMWWGKDGNGYVCELNDAGQYDGERAAKMRETDVPWPVEYVHDRAILHVRRDMIRD